MNENKEIFNDLWGEESLTYLQNSAGSNWMKYLLSLLLREIHPKEIKTVADMGCGIGLKTVQLAEHFKFAKVHGCDLSSNGISVARNYWKNVPNLTFSMKDITEAENMQETYDLICVIDVLEHIEDWEAMVDKVIALANKYILFTFPTGRMRKYESKIGHFRNFKKNEIEGYMQSKGLVTIRAIYAGFPFWSPIARDMINLFYDENKPVVIQKMTMLNKFFHKVWYILFRYFSSIRIGDNTLCLFKKGPSLEN